ncbi:MAG TPA: YdcF family protein [Pyrinomonadaceae bacterium]|nr:YdcF family protein [Pyrinomonadaceae bacterium]
MRRRATILAAALLLAWPPLAWAAAGWLVVESRPETSDALVVLGGSSTYGERTEYAARLFKEGFAPRVLLTDDGLRGGWSQAEQRNPFFVERAAAALEAAGVSRESVETLEPRTSSTYEEAMLLREQASARGLSSLLVVTSGYHSRRARWTFERVFRGSGVRLSFAAVEPGRQTPPPAVWWLSPRGWRLVALEYLKLAYYRLRY